MLRLDEIEQLRACIVFLDDAVADIRSVETRNEDACVRQCQAAHDLFSRHLIRGGGQGDARNVRKTLVQHRQLDVFRAEVVPPLRHAVRFVDCEQSDTGTTQQLLKAGCHQPFRGDIQQIDITVLERPLGCKCFAPIHRRIQARRPHPDLMHRRHLILHQGDQRRYDDAGAKPGLRAYERGNLVAQ